MGSAGKRLRLAVSEESPLQIVGTINAYTALLAEGAGFKAIYLSGAGVANASYGLPDLGMTTLSDVLLDASRITSVTDCPLLIDADTGWGHALMIARTVKASIKTGVAGLHIEDQIGTKRCGHRPNKQIVSTTEMCDRIKAAVDARTDPDFVIMARSDAFANEGLDGLMERLTRYSEAGADMLFPEALTELAHYQTLCQYVNKPVLANLTEFGQTPMLMCDELNAAGVAMVLYPLSAFRAMSYAANNVYQTIRDEGTQKSLLSQMQTREQLYEVLGYHTFENTLDSLFGKDTKDD